MTLRRRCLCCCGLEIAEEHVLAVRVYDRYENVVAVKAVVR